MKVDHRTPEWPRVARVLYQVRQHYRYTYTDAVWDLRQRLIMIPSDGFGDQRLLSHQLEVRGTEGRCELTWEQDDFGNRVGRVRAERVPHAIDFEARFRVERKLTPGARSFGAASPTPSFLEPTALTAPDARLKTVARSLARGKHEPRALVERAHDWAASAISYQYGLTGVQTPATMALHFGRGVCQDFAHIMLSVVRLLGVPARYVSGHLLGEGAPHAWVEALIEDPAAPGGVDVLGFDPTHHRRVGLNYITVAVGRDYADVSPTSGYFTGPAAGRLSSSKQAELVELDYVDGDSSSEAA